MIRSIINSLIFFCLVSIVASCKPERKTERAFYFWKSVLRLNPAEQKAMTDLKVKKLYVKFFDVVWDAKAERPIPSAKIMMEPASREWLKDNSVEMIPTIFITNETLQSILPETVTKLGDRIDYLLKGLLEDNLLPGVKEIQIDCDWTAATRDKYFELLKYMKLLPVFSGKNLSVTIRLYQSKFSEKTGVPPADRGLLMCYNMGNLKNLQSGNSILDPAVLAQYTEHLNSYPLPLDIALPLFEWKVLFRQGNYQGLVQDLADSVLANPAIAIQKDNRYEIQADTVLQGYELKKGDLLRNEKVPFADIEKSARMLSPLLRTPQFNVALYHLDSTTLSKYSLHELETIYNSLH